MKQITDLMKGVPTIDGDVVDDIPAPSVNVNHRGRIQIDGTHAAVGRIVSERYAQKIAHDQRIADAKTAAVIQGVWIFAAIRAALMPATQKDSASKSVDNSAEMSAGHSCTDGGDFGDYCYTGE